MAGKRKGGFGEIVEMLINVMQMKGLFDPDIDRGRRKGRCHEKPKLVSKMKNRKTRAKSSI